MCKLHLCDKDQTIKSCKQYKLPINSSLLTLDQFLIAPLTLTTFDISLITKWVNK